jgi:glycosyltransferase involved in cell wall biosynthesis
MPTSPKLLLACYEVTGYGGASTSAYGLFKALRRDGIDVSLVNLIEEQDVPYYRYALGENFGNPLGLENVHNAVLAAPVFGPQPKLEALLRQVAPSVLIGIGWIAAKMLKQASPASLLLFLTTGCEALKQSIELKLVGDFLAAEAMLRADKGAPVFPRTGEQHAVETADLILTHSEMTMFLLRHYYWSHAGKIHSRVIWMAEWIYAAALDFAEANQPFSQRDIDVLFIASSWSRPEKNFGLVEKMSSRLKGKNIHVVGAVVKPLRDVTQHGLLRQAKDVFRLMGRAKVVVCPSLFDAAPGILFEASAMGSNIVASKNCGNWQICDDRLLVDRFDLEVFVEKTMLALTRKFEDNIDHFLQAKSYAHLLEVASVDWGRI